MDYIHSIFSNKDSAADIRRRRLVVDLSSVEGPVPPVKVRYVSPRIAEAYASLTEKTLTRDINELIGQGLVIKTSVGLIATKNLMRAFLPPKRKVI